MPKKTEPGGDHRDKQRSPNLRPAWQPGQSGNPSGRRKGESLLGALKEALGDTQLLGKPNPGGKTNRRLMAETAIFHAIKGRSAYFREIMERLYGKVPLRVEQTNVDDGDDLGLDPHVIEAGIRAMEKAAGEDRGPEA